MSQIQGWTLSLTPKSRYCQKSETCICLKVPYNAKFTLPVFTNNNSSLSEKRALFLRDAVNTGLNKLLSGELEFGLELIVRRCSTEPRIKIKL